MITKKHYIEIAWLLHNFIKENKTNRELINEFCVYFETDNPNFDSERFKKAVFE